MPLTPNELEYAQELQDRQKYLQRLQQELEYRVSIGELTTDEAEKQFSKVSAYMMRRWEFGAKGKFKYRLEDLEVRNLLPYAEELFIPEDQWVSRQQQIASRGAVRPAGLTDEEWQAQVAEIEKPKIAKEKQQVSSRSYINQLTPYINSLLFNKQLSEDDAQRLISTTQRRLDAGIEPKELPEYQGVQQYWKGVGQMPSLLEEQNRRALEQYWTPKPGQREVEQAMLGGTTSQWARDETAMQGKFEGWEDVRQRQLGELGSGRDWIKRWELENMPNPYEYQPQTLGGQLEQDITRLAQDVEKYSQMSQQEIPAWATPGSIADQLTDIAEFGLRNAQEALASAQGQRDEWAKSLYVQSGQGGQLPVKPTAPNAPDWLVGLVPELGVGQPIRKDVNIPTPSPQQWRATPESVKQPYFGYLDWAGRPAGDVMARMQQMLPESPYGGAGSWRPARQKRG